MEGYVPIAMSDERYAELMATVDDAKAQSTARQRPQQPGGGGCGMVVIVSLPGPTIDRSCSGGCGFIDRLLGRSCAMVGGVEGDDLHIYCTCTGGWFNRLFGLRPA